MLGLIIGLIAVVWIIGFGVSGVGYYGAYLKLHPNFWRGAAAVFWPVGIPLDYALRLRRRRLEQRK